MAESRFPGSDEAARAPGEAALGLAREALALVAGLIAEFGPRIAGTGACHRAASRLERELAGRCDRAWSEPFEMRPGALLALGKVIAACFLAATAATAFGPAGSFAAAAALSAGALYGIVVFVLYLDAFDGLFGPANGRNVIGVVEPSGKALRQVLIAAHLDSSFVYPFYERWPRLYAARFAAPILVYLVSTIASIIVAAFLAAGAPPPPWSGALPLVMVPGLALVLPLYGFISRRPSPGAGDDLIGCAIGLEVAGRFSGGDLRSALRHTRVVVLFTDGEECGQKGAKAYISRNADLLGSPGSAIIVVDNVYRLGDLTVLRRDRNGVTGLSPRLASGLARAAAGLGLGLSVSSIPPGGGGTDAAQFARRGFEASCIVADSLSPLRDEILFHTGKDLPDRIEADAVAAVIDLLSAFIVEEDRLASGGEGALREAALPPRAEEPAR